MPYCNQIVFVPEPKKVFLGPKLDQPGSWPGILNHPSSKYPIGFFNLILDYCRKYALWRTEVYVQTWQDSLQLKAT